LDKGTEGKHKFIYFGSMCTIMYGYAHSSVSSCGLFKARTEVIWSFDALQGNRKVHSVDGQMEEISQGRGIPRGVEGHSN